MRTDESFPTILIAATEELLSDLKQRLQPDGYLVFEATKESEALHVVISQSRRIDVLLADVNMGGPTLAATLKRYRPEMRIMFVAAFPKQNLSDAMSPEIAIAQVRKVLLFPKGMAASGRRMGFLGRANTDFRTALKKEPDREREPLVHHNGISPAFCSDVSSFGELAVS